MKFNTDKHVVKALDMILEAKISKLLVIGFIVGSWLAILRLPEILGAL